jgi:hypothetical protein
MPSKKIELFLNPGMSYYFLSINLPIFLCFKCFLYEKLKPPAVACTCNPNYSGGFWFETSPCQNLRHYLKNNLKKEKGLGA